MSDAQFRIGISADFRVQAEGLLEPVLAELLAPYPFIEQRFLPEAKEVTPELIADCDAVITLRPRYSAASFSGRDRLAIIARWGVGYDMIDVAACTANDILLAITTDAVRKPVAEAILTLLLALAKRLPDKDRLVRQGRWEIKGQFSGLGMSGKTVGSVGLGNIGAEMFRLLQPFDLGRRLAYDPYISPTRAAALAVELTDLRTLFALSDFVVINCPLNESTRGLVNA
jgi:D-3-phosphoglycerate dehydrogenase